MDIKEIQNLIKFVAKSGASEVKLEMDDIKITIKTGPDPDITTAVNYAPVAPQLPQAPTALVGETKPAVDVSSAVTPAATESSKYITIKSPIIGTFYRKPAPDKPLFV